MSKNSHLSMIGLMGGALLLGVPPDPACADDKRQHGRVERSHGVHQDEVLEALKRNEIRPLAEVISAAEKVLPGTVIGVKVKRKEGRLLYELKIIANEGRVREVYIDAATLETMKTE